MYQSPTDSQAGETWRASGYRLALIIVPCPGQLVRITVDLTMIIDAKCSDLFESIGVFNTSERSLEKNTSVLNVKHNQ